MVQTINVDKIRTGWTAFDVRGEKIGDVAEIGSNYLLVVKGPQMLSMISIRDLIRVDMQDKGEEIRYLREYLYQVPPEPARPTASA